MTRCSWRAACTLAAPVLAVIAACALEPDVGPRLAGSCRNADTNPDAPVSFANDIRPLFNRTIGGCGCHVPSADGPGTGTQLSGLDLSSLASLRAGGATSGSRIVVAGEPCSSILYLKIEQAPPFGSRMPLGGPPFFTDEEEDLLHDWIAEGAANN
jgi:hypothetical protein